MRSLDCGVALGFQPLSLVYWMVSMSKCYHSCPCYLSLGAGASGDMMSAVMKKMDGEKGSFSTLLKSLYLRSLVRRIGYGIQTREQHVAVMRRLMLSKKPKRKARDFPSSSEYPASSSMLEASSRPPLPVTDEAGSVRRESLETRWYALMRQELPAAARAEGGWPIRLDHCFMRVALDNYFGKCWYEVLDKQKGAVKSMSDEQLAGAVKVAEGMLKGGKASVVSLNIKSLDLRGKKGPRRKLT
eukprot:gnl/TRDRNA2_/TRDRNA2_135965_c0_seq3.p1 gnl/TRDRNA2_/TRDRNA2_135965_c0~~gnl/TRDRNA2_/TRDRNA2_135965_c0_seq3.p1  ORF type:complete len:243 (-),score=40.93 gnl/TRDRNA2_/TRDRNA2_135965_c0_seq3:212-940(-)